MTYVNTHLKREIVIDSIVTIHYFEYSKDFAFHGESHNFWEFLYVDKGTVAVTAGTRHLLLHSGDIVFHKPNEFHAFRSDGSSPLNLAVCSFLCFSSPMKFFEDRDFTLTDSERQLISMIINEAKDSFRTPINLPSIEQVLLKAKTPFASQQLISIYLELFLITCYRDHAGVPLVRNASRQIDTKTNKRRQMLFRQVTDYMQAHICDQLDVAGICSAFSLSRSSLHALFQKEKGYGPIDYFNRLKIQKAKELIREGSLNLSEISYFLNFSSPSYFSKRFKKTTGMPPAKYASSVKGMTEALRGEA